MAGLKKTWVAEYSVDQKAFHVGELADSLRKNVAIVAGDTKGCSYIPFWVGDSEDEANRAVAEMKGMKKILKSGKR